MRRAALAVVAVLALAVTLVVTPTATAAPVPTGDRGTSSAERPQARSKALVTAVTIGYTQRGRPIRAFLLGDPSSTRKVVFVGAIHGNETGPSRVLTNLRDGPRIRGVKLWVIPYFNKDGVRRHTRKNARGVDLNRNFPWDWRRQYGAYSSGKGPASERETRVLMRFLRNVNPQKVIGFHQPLYGVDDSYRKTRAFARTLARELELPRKVFRCNSGCHGTMTQWVNHKRPGMALTVEYGHRMTKRQLNLSPGGLLRSIGGRRG